MAFSFLGQILGEWVPETETEKYIHKIWWVRFHPNFLNPRLPYYLGPVTPAKDGEFIDADGLITDAGLAFLDLPSEPLDIPSFEEMCADLGFPVLSRDDLEVAQVFGQWRELVISMQNAAVLEDLDRPRPAAVLPELAPLPESAPAPASDAKGKARDQHPRRSARLAGTELRRSARLAMKATVAVAITEQL